ncbi:MAG: acyltransferase [Sphingobium sp.]|nr:acyltransferase [Sphingobium sp.]
MRGIAALLVVAYHLQFGARSLLPFEAATPFFRTGYLWVDLFFILSGFVISYSSRLDERAPYDGAQIRSFMVARFARIYPLHVFALAVLVVVVLGEHAVTVLAHKPLKDGDIFSAGSLLNLAEQAFLLNAWGFTGRIGWNIPSWSISAEWVAYMLFPLLAAFIARWRRASLATLGMLALAFYAWIGATTTVLDIVKGVALLRCLAGFGLGMILYTQRHRFAALGDLTLGLLQAAGAVVALAPMILGLNDVFAIPGFFLLVAATWTDRGWLATPLRTRPLHWLGDISYSVYLNHLWILSAWHFVSTPVLHRLALPPMLDRAIVILGAYALVLIVSAVTYRMVELPAREAIVTAYRRRRAAPASSSLQAENPLT